MTQVFISYARKDSRELALRLRDDLTKAGYSVWLDLSEIELGGNFTQDIERAIDTCDVALLLMSHASRESQWCRVEQIRAIRKGKKVIPLRIQSDTEPPLHLEHLNFIDFSDLSAYDAHLRDMLSDIAASQAFQNTNTIANPSQYKVVREGRAASERRNAPAFRRHIRELRDEDWGLRNWWTYFLFHTVSLTDAVRILTDGKISSPRTLNPKAKSQWDRFVRFHFRPRHSEFFTSEGFIPKGQITTKHLPIPIYLLFDMEALLLQPEARFSDGDPSNGSPTFATPNAFSELPFEMIYHDSWVRSHERDEIVRHREAQVLLPNTVTLEGLQLIWVRSEAEYETLHTLLGADLWHKWRDKITHRGDAMLYNHKRPYVTHARLDATKAELCWNPCLLPVTEGYKAHCEVRYHDGRLLRWEQNDFLPHKPLVFTLDPKQGYHLSLTLDGELAYSGYYNGEAQIL
jgi:hypothetical protein